jgi:hypothetical protein
MAKTPESESAATGVIIDFAFQLTNLLHDRWHVCPLEYFILETLRGEGKEFNHSKAMLRSKLTATVQQFDCGEANLVRILNHLQDLRLVNRLHFTLQERRRIFEDAPGNNRMGIVLTDAGQETISQIREAIANPSWFVNP